MSQDLPVTAFAILGLLTFGDELTGYEVKQRADSTLRFYWSSPAMSQIYTELGRLTERGLLRADTRSDGGRDVTTYAITDEGRASLRDWMAGPVGFPVLKHSVLLRLLVGHAGEPEQIRTMLKEYAEQAIAARDDLAEVRAWLAGSDQPGDAFFHPSVVADWGLDYFEAEARHARRALKRLEGSD